MFNIDAVMRRKDTEIEAEPCVVAKVIELPMDDFFRFRNHLLEDYSFLTDNNDLMGFDDDNNRHCLLILGKDYDDGILVDTQGCSYARYTAHVPNGRQLAEINQYQSLNDFNQRMVAVAEDVTSKVLENHDGGVYYIGEKDIPISIDDRMFSYPLLSEMLSERDEIGVMERFSKELAVTVNPKYLLNVNGEGKATVLTQDDVDIMLAKHMLFLKDAGGEQADFTNCVIKFGNLSHAVLNGAILNNTVFVNCKLTDAEMCSADAVGAKFYSCELRGACCEETDFSYAKFRHCTMHNMIATHSCFVGADFESCTIKGMSLKNCCIDRATWDNTDISSAKTEGISTSYEEWSSDNELKSINLE